VRKRRPNQTYPNRSHPTYCEAKSVQGCASK
jgi:hypothetical protein